MQNTKSLIRIATRKSDLAMWQAHYVEGLFNQHFPNTKVEIVPMSTKGDRILDTPLAKIGGKGLFIKELEVAMQEGKADLAVHSMKDVPVDFPPEFGLHCICERENPFDAFVSNTVNSLDDLPHGAVVGTSSLRRQAQLRALRPDIKIKDLRGNVNTRLKKLDDGQYDAIILAAAGLIRLNMHQRIKHEILPELSLPAVGQGAVGVECRNDDSVLIEMLAQLNHKETALRVTAERAMNAKLQGGCQVPIGSYALFNAGNSSKNKEEYQSPTLMMTALVASVDGTVILKSMASRDCQLDELDTAVELGEFLASELLDKGARAILDAL